MKRIDITENGINIVFSLEDNGQIKLMHFSALPFNEQNIWHEMFEQDFHAEQNEYDSSRDDGSFFVFDAEKIADLDADGRKYEGDDAD